MSKRPRGCRWFDPGGADEARARALAVLRRDATSVVARAPVDAHQNGMRADDQLAVAPFERDKDTLPRLQTSLRDELLKLVENMSAPQYEHREWTDFDAHPLCAAWRAYDADPDKNDALDDSTGECTPELRVVTKAEDDAAMVYDCTKKTCANSARGKCEARALGADFDLNAFDAISSDECVLCVRRSVTETWITAYVRNEPTRVSFQPYRSVVGPGEYRSSAMIPRAYVARASVAPRNCTEQRFAGISDAFVQHVRSRYAVDHANRKIVQLDVDFIETPPDLFRARDRTSAIPSVVDSSLRCGVAKRFRREAESIGTQIIEVLVARGDDAAEEYVAVARNAPDVKSAMAALARFCVSDAYASHYHVERDAPTILCEGTSRPMSFTAQMFARAVLVERSDAHGRIRKTKIDNYDDDCWRVFAHVLSWYLWACDDLGALASIVRALTLTGTRDKLSRVMVGYPNLSRAALRTYFCARVASDGCCSRVFAIESANSTLIADAATLLERRARVGEVFAREGWGAADAAATDCTPRYAPCRAWFWKWVRSLTAEGGAGDECGGADAAPRDIFAHDYGVRNAELFEAWKTHDVDRAAAIVRSDATIARDAERVLRSVAIRAVPMPAHWRITREDMRAANRLHAFCRRCEKSLLPIVPYVPKDFKSRDDSANGDDAVGACAAREHKDQRAASAAAKKKRRASDRAFVESCMFTMQDVKSCRYDPFSDAFACVKKILATRASRSEDSVIARVEAVRRGVECDVDEYYYDDDDDSNNRVRKCGSGADIATVTLNGRVVEFFGGMIALCWRCGAACFLDHYKTATHVVQCVSCAMLDAEAMSVSTKCARCGSKKHKLVLHINAFNVPVELRDRNCGPSNSFCKVSFCAKPECANSVSAALREMKMHGVRYYNWRILETCF